MKYRAAINRFNKDNLRDKIRDSLEWLNWGEKITPDSRLWIKPNLTFPEYREGATTSPHFMEALLDVLKERTSHLTVFEGDGGNNSYPAEKAFKAHNLYKICESRNVRLINISRMEWEWVDIPTKSKIRRVPLCREMIRDADMTISVPVPKMHFVARFTGAVKNHWGTIPDSMRLRNHYFFRYAINEIIKLLKSNITVVDGEYFMDDNGPVTGEPVKMDLVIAADNPLTADMVMMDIMDVDPGRIGYIKTAWENDMGPRTVADIELNQSIENFKTHKFSYHRDPVDYLAMLGFYSRIITWIVYLSPLKAFIHWLVKQMRGGSRQIDSYFTGIIESNEPK